MKQFKEFINNDNATYFTSCPLLRFESEFEFVKHTTLLHVIR